MNILFIGDVVGRPGREVLIEKLPALVKKHKPDFVISNGENAASGKGITPKIYNHLIESGIDLITGGNHILKRTEILEIIDKTETQLLRPANFKGEQPGWGFATIRKNGLNLQVINVQGQVFMEDEVDSPFSTVDKILQEYPSKFVIVDFHAEATSEKRALAEYFDGRISALLGTHTHVTTADEQILKNGTGFITDVGMTGPTDSILGVKKELVIKRMLEDEKTIFEVADGPATLSAVLVELEKDGTCKSIVRVKS